MTELAAASIAFQQQLEALRTHPDNEQLEADLRKAWNDLALRWVMRDA